MPVGIDGQWNLAALQVPGVYVDIIPPNPNLNGAPTNIVGLVGVASWGAVNGITDVSNPTDCSVKLGNPAVRSYDIATYIAAGINVGGSAAFKCVRVSDGTDTAASASIQSAAITLTGRYSGTLGNKITYSAAAGTQVGSYAFTIGFPGAAAEVFNNIGLGIGSIAVTPGTAYTSVPAASVSAPPAGPAAVQAVVNPTLKIVGAVTVTAGGSSGFVVGDKITLSNGIVLTVGTVSAGVITAVTIFNAGQLLGGNVPANPLAMVSQTGSGVGVPTFTVGWGVGTPVIVNPGSGYLSAPTVTFTGGGGSSAAYAVTLAPWLNLANAINNGNATHGPSRYVVALAGTSGATPTLATVTTLSGGTDGAAAVVDATIIGTDTLPRTGMYVLRKAGCAALACCDITTAALWPAMDVFALSETMTNCVATQSGDSLAGAVATRLSVGLDSSWTWIAAGDFPTFFDSYNGYSRQISPVAFMAAFIGNWSPEQSPLNKVLRGISATQKTVTGIPYADADLQVANMGGIDVILGPQQSIGGNYFSFATGRNASSNTAANGLEYTTLTNFLAKTAQSKAAGSVVGKLQSIQFNDPTRLNAKALFDGFSAELANPASGSGGYGIIDTWAVQCDLNNNPPNLQARGYLFLYWTVRYLNVVRYFVVKLAGGGNVTVTVQNTPPTPAQFQ